MTVLGLAGTALPFAQSVDDEVERWLRPLRLYGKAGVSLQSLGIGDVEGADAADEAEPATATPQETLHLVTAEASKLAAERDASSVGTIDILNAVMRHYGPAFERALSRRSSGTAALKEQLAVQS